MQGKVHVIISSVLAAVLCSGCVSWFSQKAGDGETPPEEKKVLPPLHLGAVHQVYPAQKFALLRIIGPIPAPGTTLISHPADGSTTRIGNLMVSENSSSRRGMLVADIRSGSVVSGDRVFLYRNIAVPDETDLEKARAQKNNATQGELPKPPPLRIRTTDNTVEQTETPPRPTSGEDEPVVETPSLPEGAPASVESDPVAPPAAPSEPGNPVAPPAAPVEPSQSPPTPPQQHPDYLNDIPDNIDDWN